MSSYLKMVTETKVPAENHRLTPSHWQLPNMPVSRFETEVKDNEHSSSLRTFGYIKRKSLLNQGLSLRVINVRGY